MMVRLPASFAAASTLTLASLFACSSKHDDATPTTSNANVSWLVGSTSITATAASGQVSGNTLGFSATSTDGGLINAVTFNSLPRATGTYSLAGTTAPTNTGPSGYYLSDDGTYAATSGSIVITTLGASNMIGTFAFTATKLNGTPTKVVSNGKFNVSF